jgi:hypothetical protein
VFARQRDPGHKRRWPLAPGHWAKLTVAVGGYLRSARVNSDVRVDQRIRSQDSLVSSEKERASCQHPAFRFQAHPLGTFGDSRSCLRYLEFYDTTRSRPEKVAWPLQPVRLRERGSIKHNERVRSGHISTMGNSEDERSFSDSSPPAPDDTFENQEAYEKEALLQNGSRATLNDTAADQKLAALRAAVSQVLQRNVSFRERFTRTGAVAAKALQHLNGSVLLAIMAYALCSSCMLVVNKVSLCSRCFE